ncbi:MAG TPA: hypothetical protein VKQ36_02665 [Ktedonobacterales bacterium]|nr:hypothetical protein [Ktedonobacterales bacterium]
MPTYAAHTTVGADRSRAEIERTLERYGATSFAYGWQKDIAVISFEARDRRIRLTLTMPHLEQFRWTATHQRRSDNSTREAWEQAKRQRWRALALYVKAKLEAIEAGIISFEDAWLPHTVLPDGRTVSEWLQPQLADALAENQLPSLLPAPGVDR